MDKAMKEIFNGFLNPTLEIDRIDRDAPSSLHLDAIDLFLYGWEKEDQGSGYIKTTNNVKLRIYPAGLCWRFQAFGLSGQILFDSSLTTV